MEANDEYSVKTVDLPPVIKGSSDWREYRPLLLPNGVTVVLVNDKESKTTSCAVSVGAGASADPRELSGLAHFTEHMSFLGSEAYPKENEFKQYLSKHGGRSNASTSMSCTTYKFEVLADHAEKVIDIFSNFFIAPLFTQSGTNREVNAVDSENSKNESNDARRRLQILKALADPDHHYSKFSTGNIKTLPAVEEDKAAFVREALLAFHKRHYRPDNMTVVLIGPQKLEVLEKWIVPRFEKIVNPYVVKNREDMTEAEKLVDDYAKDAPNESFGAASVPYNSAFRPELQNNKWPILLTSKPLQNIQKLFLYFPLPSTRDLGDHSPYALICHLLGHEGVGSCFATLQDADLVDFLSVGPRLSDVDQSVLQINVSLTMKGEEHWEYVAKVLFEYSFMLLDVIKKAKNGEEKEMQTLKRIWDEILTLRTLDFHQSSPSSAFSMAPTLASNVRKFGTEKCLSLGSLLNETKDSLPLDNFLTFMENIKPENCIVERFSKSAWDSCKEYEKHDDIFGFQKEKWYGVSYHLTPVDKAIVDSWKGLEVSNNGNTCSVLGSYNLSLPDENKHIPRDLSMCEELSQEAKEGPQISKHMEPPTLLVENKFGRLWHRLDDRYCLPKSMISFLIRTPEVENVFDSNEWSYDTKASYQSGILQDVFQDAFAQELYDSDLAGLHYNISTSSNGLHFNFSGYSSANNGHLIDFALNIMDRFLNNQESSKSNFITEKHFRTSKDKYLRYLKSYMQSKRADSYAVYYTDLVLSSRGQGIDHTISEVESITLDTLKEHYKRLVSADAPSECIFGGNVGREAAKDFYSKACTLIANARVDGEQNLQRWIPGPFERKLNAGEEIHLHFQSQNKEEQNGSVVITYQSGVPSFKGSKISKPESLVECASIRTLTRMLREPLFNELRTKQQLGYIVSSYYDSSISAVSSAGAPEDTLTLETTSIDTLVINVLSKKFPPPVLKERIDQFLETFRDRVKDLSEEELKSYTDALSEQLLKPKQKLVNEISIQMRKIINHAHAPNIQLKSGTEFSYLPWDSSKELVESIQRLTPNDLLNTWDRVVAGKNRSRIVSHVYGSSFPLLSDNKNGDVEARTRSKVVKLNTLKEIQEHRRKLVQFSENSTIRRGFMHNNFSSLTTRKKIGVTIGVIGASCFLYAITVGRHERPKRVGK